MGLNTYRYLMNISYLGTNYSGWQIQDNAATVQGAIMNALHVILNNQIPLIVGAGRTDSGVHAVNFCAHFDSVKIDCQNTLFKLNNFLPNDIAIHSIHCVKNDFHARYSAVSRRYEYWISTIKDPFLINRSYIYIQNLDIKLMNMGAQFLVGKKDFSSFSKSKSDNTICDIYMASFNKSKNMLIFTVEADRFLYNMVRCIVGTLINLGLQKIDLDDLSKIMLSKDRTQAGYSAPACGLYLMNIEYPKKYHCEVS